jgi:hypothetical protein
MTNPEAHKFFKETFGLKFGEYLDGEMSVLMGMKPILDPFKFETWLGEKHPGLREDVNSMQMVLIKYYGQNVADKIQQLITGETL